MTEPFKCPMDCPNRESDIGKGYSYLFSILLTSLLVWQSFDVKYSKANDWELKTKEVPIALLVPCLFFIAGALGINTDPIAKKVTDILDKGQP